MINPNHREYLHGAARAFCSVCTIAGCNRSKSEKGRCALLVSFRDSFSKEVESYRYSDNLPPTKVCTCCGEEKPLADFSKTRGGKFGRSAQCKSCICEKKKQRYQQRKLVAPSLETLSMVKKLKGLQTLLGKAKPVVTAGHPERMSLRYQLDEEYKKGRKEYAKKSYYDDNVYLAKKYLKRYEGSLEKAKAELAKIQTEMPNLTGRALYLAKCRERTFLARVESFNYKASLCRSILEGGINITQEDMEKAGILHVKSVLLKRAEN